MSTATYLAVVFGTVAVAALALLIIALGTIDDYRDATRIQRLREQALRAALLDDDLDTTVDLSVIADIVDLDGHPLPYTISITANEQRDPDE